MSGTLAGAMVTAGVLGVTPAVEPDHGAGISSLTAANGDARISALVGAWFSLGHVALVAAWLLVASLVFATVLLSRTGAGVVSLAVLTYGVSITATMSLLGAGVGVVFERLDERGPTYHATARAVAGVAVTTLGAFLLADAIGTLL